MFDYGKNNKSIVAHIHLFGIAFGQEILDKKYIAQDIVDLAGIRAAYFAEVSKG